MRKLISIAITDLRVTFTDKSLFVFMVLMPVLLIIGIGFATTAMMEDGAEQARELIDVYDNDGTSLSAQLLTSIKDIDDHYVFCPAENTPDDICQLGDDSLTAERSNQRLESNTIIAVIEIPAGFESSVQSGETESIVYRSAEDITQQSVAFATLEAAITRVNGLSTAYNFAQDLRANSGENLPETFADDALSQAAALWQENPITINVETMVMQTPEEGEETLSQPSGFQQSVPGMGTMYAMFTVMGGAYILIEERKYWTLQRVMTMPVTRMQFIGGKMLSRFLMGMLQFVVAFATGVVVGSFTDVSYGNDPFGLLLVMMAFSFFMAAFTLLLATFVQTEQQVGSLSTIVALTLAPIGGAWWSLEMEFVPEFMRTISYLSPVKYAMDAFNTIISGGSWVETLPYLAVLVVGGVIMWVIGASRFQYD